MTASFERFIHENKDGNLITDPFVDIEPESSSASSTRTRIETPRLKYGCGRHPGFERFIHENKDGNPVLLQGSGAQLRFERFIHENKDGNS